MLYVLSLLSWFSTPALAIFSSWQGLWKQLVDFYQQIPRPIPILAALLLGALLVTWGYALFRIWLFALGACLGYALAHQLGLWLHLSGELYWVGCLLLMLAMALFTALAFKASIFVASFYFSSYLVHHLAIGFFGLDSRWLILILGTIGGILACEFIRPFLIAGTALSGAYLVVSALNAWLSQEALSSWLQPGYRFDNFVAIVFLLLAIVLAVFGYICQSQFTCTKWRKL